MELEHLITPYMESLVNRALQDIEPILKSDDFSNKENIKNFLEEITTIENELVSLGGTLSPHIKDKINEIINLISDNDKVHEGE